MCGRFALAAPWKVIVELLEARAAPEVASWRPAYNLCPTDLVPIVRIGGEGERELALHRWGLVPHWMKDPRRGARFINARAETVATTPAFRDAFRQRRCLVPASGFYEWTLEPSAGGKQPHWIHPPAGGFDGGVDGTILTFAGLWAWHPGDDRGPLLSFTVLTTEASAALASIHDRMPVILPPEARGLWLDRGAGVAELDPLLRPYAGPLRHHPVGRAVNHVRAEGAELIEPLASPRGEDLGLDL